MFTGKQEWPLKDISQLPRHLWVHPIRARGLNTSSLLKYSLAWWKRVRIQSTQALDIGGIMGPDGMDVPTNTEGLADVFERPHSIIFELTI